jgi:hypothetical protein
VHCISEAVRLPFSRLIYYLAEATTCSIMRTHRRFPQWRTASMGSTVLGERRRNSRCPVASVEQNVIATFLFKPQPQVSINAFDVGARRRGAFEIDRSPSPHMLGRETCNATICQRICRPDHLVILILLILCGWGYWPRILQRAAAFVISSTT